MMQDQLQRPLRASTLEMGVPAEAPINNDKKQRRGALWVLGSFVLCPCHLPVTLGLLAAVFSGTALGAFIVHYSLLAGTITTLLWAAGTWYGFSQLRARQTCSIRRP